MGHSNVDVQKAHIYMGLELSYLTWDIKNNNKSVSQYTCTNWNKRLSESRGRIVE